ncbi:uncharacterized protein LOC141849314 [Brevipalpus obovatus]|uniref:uncharacterized protein LOC141849314 n=1 Tax=Brevipalpus obovatus TaxID=246614 RepID=UPI003D9E73A5
MTKSGFQVSPLINLWIIALVASCAFSLDLERRGHPDDDRLIRRRSHPLLRRKGLIGRSGSNLIITRIPFNATDDVVIGTSSSSLPTSTTTGGGGSDEDKIDGTIERGKIYSNSRPSNYSVSIVSVSMGDQMADLTANGPTMDPNSSTENSGEVQNDSVPMKKIRQGKKLLPWNSKRHRKLPIRPPKLRSTNKTATTRSRRISYGSLNRIRNLTETNLVPLEYTNLSASNEQDILEISSSEKHRKQILLDDSPPIPRRTELVRLPRFHKVDNSYQPSERRMDDDLMNSNLTMTESSGFSTERFKNMPKLLLPKFSRPAMYSLNGFIPRPNSRRFTSTTSTTARPILSSWTNDKRRRNKEQRGESKSTFFSRSENKKFDFTGQDLAEDGDLRSSGTIDRKNYVLTRRRGDSIASSRESGKHPQQLSNNNSPSQYQQRSSSKMGGRTGQPGRDYPVLASIPRTSFNCENYKNGGFYGDPETGCQVWHMCQGISKHSFLCPNGTIFNQRSGICDWWYNVDCDPVPGSSALPSSQPSSVTVPASTSTSTSSVAISSDLSESASSNSRSRVVLDFERRKRVYNKYFHK